MVVSGLKFRALIDLQRGECLLFRSPGDAERTALLQEYSLAAEQGLDHFETLQLVCEMRHLVAGFDKLRMALNEESDMLCLMNLNAWPPQPGRFSDQDRLLEIGPATVAKWNCVGGFKAFAGAGRRCDRQGNGNVERKSGAKNTIRRRT